MHGETLKYRHISFLQSTHLTAPTPPQYVEKLHKQHKHIDWFRSVQSDSTVSK